MRIIQISDSHISLEFPDRLADLQQCVAAVNAQSPDLVVHSGDVAHNASEEEYRLARQALEQLQAPYFVMPGNKDTRAGLTAVFSDRLQLHDEYIQYVLDDYPVRMLMIDTVSTDSNKGALCQRRLDHIASVLSDENVKPLLVFMHHTPYEVTEIPDPFQFEDWTVVEQLNELFQQCQMLQAVYCGHVHRNVGTTLNGLPITAISCMARDLRKGKLSVEDQQRPMFRVIEL